MAAAYALGAGLIVLLHLAFVGFAVGGALFVLRWPKVVFAHLPAVAWAAYIELAGGVCPLTPLENQLRAYAGLNLYSEDFVARYFLPVLYPAGLTREAQVVIGLLVLGVNAAGYAVVYKRRRSSGGEP